MTVKGSGKKDRDVQSTYHLWCMSQERPCHRQLNGELRRSSRWPIIRTSWYCIGLLLESSGRMQVRSSCIPRYSGEVRCRCRLRTTSLGASCEFKCSRISNRTWQGVVVRRKPCYAIFRGPVTPASRPTIPVDGPIEWRHRDVGASDRYTGNWQ